MKWMIRGASETPDTEKFLQWGTFLPTFPPRFFQKAKKSTASRLIFNKTVWGYCPSHSRSIVKLE